MTKNMLKALKVLVVIALIGSAALVPMWIRDSPLIAMAFGVVFIALVSLLMNWKSLEARAHDSEMTE